MEMVEGSHFHSRTTGIEGILVFFPFFVYLHSSSSNTVVRFCHVEGRWEGRLDDERQRQVAHAGVQRRDFWPEMFCSLFYVFP